MDPSSLAGLGLAVGSFTFQIFSGCLVAFKLLSAAKNLGKDAELLVCMLRLEEYRLILWAKKSGLADDNLNRRLDEQSIKTTLAELAELLTDTENLKKKYKLDLKDADVEACPVKPSKPSGATLNFLSNDTIEKEQKQILWRAITEKGKNRLLKRLWWVSVDRKQFEALIIYIGKMVQRLFDFLDIAAGEETKESLHIIQLSLLSVIEKVDDIRFATADIKSTVAPNETLETVAALRGLQIDLSHPGHSDSTVPGPTKAYKHLLRIGPDAKAGHTGHLAHYGGVPVYVEKKKYSEHDVGRRNALRSAQRAENLSRFLHIPKAPSFKSLHCIGYFQDRIQSELVFIFDRPLNSRDYTDPTSLLSLLQSNFIPSQSDRFRLAAGLATTLLHLHASGWLHRGLRSDNILFFSTSNEALRSLHDPCIVGYEYARQDGQERISPKGSRNTIQDIYDHPQAIRSGSGNYIKAFDVYSLGIMLVEIAYWTSWKSLLHKKLGTSLGDVDADRMQTVREKLRNERDCESDAFLKT